MLKDLKPQQMPGGVYAKEIMAFFKTIVCMGLKFGEGKYYWRLLIWTVLHCPKNFPFAVTMSIYGYHFRKVNQINQRREKMTNKTVRVNQKTSQPVLDRQAIQSIR